jgi:hypothetical protein
MEGDLDAYTRGDDEVGSANYCFFVSLIRGADKGGGSETSRSRKSWLQQYAKCSIECHQSQEELGKFIEW